ncbi:MAG: hypothetical protein LKJ29_09935 [Lactobacillus sp.]|jgi:hypothetical protein|nr:hypothetical protein [Lactobacillus sp.]MCI1942358.1 hypothetical protein [Lactobacillus sp.]MCI1972786.1 hypothetical protein [Lactobacillus sp.]MCI2016446.1 hypothetical protein [Lactobacillus sp.]MCI2037396.1 hypothetical protein [Lactobacillus sp.]
MPLFALLLDVIAAGVFWLQQSQGLYLLGTIIQGGLTLVLLIMLFTYQGKRFGWFNFSTWSHVFTVRFAVIVFSFLINAIMLFVYILNVTGANNVIFH